MCKNIRQKHKCFIICLNQDQINKSCYINKTLPFILQQLNLHHKHSLSLNLLILLQDEGKCRPLEVTKVEGAEVGMDNSLAKPFAFKCVPQAGNRVFYFCTTSAQEMKRYILLTKLVYFFSYFHGASIKLCNSNTHQPVMEGRENKHMPLRLNYSSLFLWQGLSLLEFCYSQQGFFFFSFGGGAWSNFSFFFNVAVHIRVISGPRFYFSCDQQDLY